VSNLRAPLDRIVEPFVSGILAVVKTASPADFAGHGGKAVAAKARAVRLVTRPTPAAPVKVAPVAKRSRSGKRHRSSAREVAAHKKVAYDTARTFKPGLRKDDVMRKSASEADLGHALSLLVADGKLTKKGDRRLTRYSVK
jgi:hypothetical protein